MTPVFIAIVFIAILVAGIFSYACFWPKHSVNEKDYPWRERRKSKSLDQLTDELMERMSLPEKVAQLSGDGGAKFLVRLGVNVLLLGRFPNHYSGRNQRLQIPPFSFSDGPRGVVIGKSTCFPVAIARAASWDVSLEQKVGDAIGKEVRASGANYFGGLCINLLRHPAWGRAQECYGEDPYLMGEFGVALLQSVQRHNVMTCAKHFALNNIENSRFYVDVEVDRRTLHEVYFPHFKRCVDAGVASIMSAYNQYDGEYCGHNRYLLQDVLREQWGFRGFVSSDWLWGIYDGSKAVAAGMDVEMPYNRHFGNLVSQVHQGAVKAEHIDRNVRRVVRTKLDFISRADLQEYGCELIASSAHCQLAREAAEKSMVLLKNTDALLPLDPGKTKKLAVIGELAHQNNIGDHGSSRVNPPYVVTLLQGLKDYVSDRGIELEVIHHRGKNLQSAAECAAQVDCVIIVAGYRHNDEGENLASNHKPGGKHKPAIGGDRSSLSLHQQEITLIQKLSEVNSNTVVSLIGGSAIVTSEWDQLVSSILMTWYPGMEGGHAFANVVFGEVNPSGKLPFSVPDKEADLVPFEAFAEKAHYGPYHGYTQLEKQDIKPAYPFGFGLSYSSFEYQMLTLDLQEWLSDASGADATLTVGVHIKNSSDIDGDEVVQLYVGFDDVADKTGIERPSKLLRGFKKVNIPAGETVCISFELSLDALKRYDPDGESWVLDEGDYQILVGPDSDNSRLLKETIAVV